MSLILVTGGTGFVGLRTVSALQTAAHRVRIFELAPKPNCRIQPVLNSPTFRSHRPFADDGAYVFVEAEDDRTRVGLHAEGRMA
jgi:nucleoside-diphosphate-sugar epimerase